MAADLPPLKIPTISQANRAGKAVRKWLQEGAPPGGLDDAVLDIVNLYRSAHEAPMQSAVGDLREALKLLDYSHSQPSSRLKRWDSIASKLFHEKNLALSRMQDLGGCRVILDDIASLDRLCAKLQDFHPGAGVSDYVRKPKESGYRGIHVIIFYEVAENRSLPVEIQLRTAIMHRWALSVEQLSDALPASVDLKRGLGPIELLDYFRVLSEFYARHEAQGQISDELSQKLTEAQKRVVELISKEE